MSTIALADTRRLPPWRTFISEISLVDGFHCWSVEWLVDEEAVRPKRGWIGVGVTWDKKNKENGGDVGYSSIAGANDWILRSASVAVVLNHKKKDEYHVPLAAQITKIWFLADPVERTVRVRWPHHSSDTRSIRFGRPILDIIEGGFDVLRPCVVLAGISSALVQSNPSDMPTQNYHEMTIFQEAFPCINFT